MNIKDLQLVLNQRDPSDTYDPIKLIIICQEVGYFGAAFKRYKDEPTQENKDMLECAFSVLLVMITQFANWAKVDIESSLERYWSEFLEYQKEMGTEPKGIFN